MHCRGCPRPLWAQESPLPFFLLPERTPRWLRCVGRVAPRAVQRARHQGRPSSSSGSALTTCQAHTPADYAQEHCCAVGLAGRRGSQVALHPNSSPVCVGFVGGCCTPSALHASPGRPQTTSSRGGPSRAPCWTARRDKAWRYVSHRRRRVAATFGRRWANMRPSRQRASWVTS